MSHQQSNVETTAGRAMTRFDLRGRTAVVTGGAQGIGKAIVERLAASGARVQLWDINDELARRVAASVSGTVIVTKVDVSDPNSVSAAAASAGQVDILVNNAAVVAPDAAWHDTDMTQWRRMMEVNLYGGFFCMQALAPAMAQRGYGRIVNIASMSGKEGSPRMAAYSAVKAAVIALTKAVARELAQSGVLVNSVAPAIIRTEGLAQVSDRIQAEIAAKAPLGRMGEPAEVAALVAWLCSEDCSYSTGFCHDVSGGRSVY